jgi:signal transduction histidine kinase
MNPSADKSDLTVFENLMHEFDTARVGIRTTISQLNKATNNGFNPNIQNLNAHMARLVDQIDILDVLFEFLKIELNPELIRLGTKVELNVHGIFYRACKHYTARFKEKELKWKLDKVEGFFVKTTSSLSIIPLILFDNAIKYSPRKAQIYITIDEVGRKISVESQGPEIKCDEIGHIFERGYRGEYAKLTNSGGQGLGLYISKRICDALGFTIKVEQAMTQYRYGGIPYATVSFTVCFDVQ